MSAAPPNPSLQRARQERRALNSISLGGEKDAVELTDVLLDPWLAVEDGAALVAELQRELAPGHPLYGSSTRAIARRGDNDDVLFTLENGQVAVVHLVWSGHAEQPPSWPWAVTYRDLEQWLSECMRRDHDEFGDSPSQ